MRCYNNCDPCNKDQCCGPACYDQEFSIMVNPFNEDIWNVTIGGKLFHVNIPPIKETDTKLSDNYTNATLNYSAEKHTDIITGNQLGQLITVGDLRDTTIDYDTPSMCYELIYTKYGSCGAGCFSAENEWHTFSPDNENALQDSLHYVRGTNAYGCPIFLDVPDNIDEWYLSGWKTEGEHKEFGYFQPRQVDDFPKDPTTGEHIFMSQIPGTKEPIIATLPLDCILNNILGNLGFSVTGQWSVIEQTAQFGADFNNMTGDFVIKWSDWNDLAEKHRAGYGRIYGSLTWTVEANASTGVITINITSVNFTNATWTMDEGVTAASKPSLHLYGIAIPNGAQEEVMPPVMNYGGASWSRTINKSIDCNYTLTLTPGQSPAEPLNFAYIWVDWVNDDRGYLGAKFTNNLSGWAQC